MELLGNQRENTLCIVVVAVMDTSSTKTDRQGVPYNLYFTLRFNCHINFEVVSTVSVVKYFYKYVYKGLDRAYVRVEEVDVNPDQPTVIDEIKNDVDARYLSA